uniref:aminotransferase class I/II-fold pyridoxal phosphate-dependent enzyme n=1 Tax=Alloprevotella sp. TaxID=1872471 RepID=UPI0015B14F93
MKQLPENMKAPRIRPKAKVRLDANESPFNSPYNRYPDEKDLGELKHNWGKHERIPASCIYFTHGTEEAVDLLMRVYALPNRDSVVAAEPTRSIYKRRAIINRVEYREAALKENDFELDAERVLEAVSDTTKIIFLCSPNSPTGNLLDAQSIETILQLFDGIVVVDESYIDFVPHKSVLPLLNKYQNLVILRSFSHAWSMAGLHLAAIVAYPNVISNVNCVGLVHPISMVVEETAARMVKNRLDVDKWVRQIVDERNKVRLALSDLPECKHIYHSDANFLLVRFTDTMAIYKYLLKNNISTLPVKGCLRITIGLPNDNSALLGALRRRMG